MRANGNETEAKLLCRVQIGQREDGSTVAANFEAIFGPSDGRNVAIFFFCQKLGSFYICVFEALQKKPNFAAIMPSFSSRSYLAVDYSYVIFYVV